MAPLGSYWFKQCVFVACLRFRSVAVHRLSMIRRSYSPWIANRRPCSPCNARTTPSSERSTCATSAGFRSLASSSSSHAATVVPRSARRVRLHSVVCATRHAGQRMPKKEVKRRRQEVHRCPRRATARRLGARAGDPRSPHHRRGRTQHLECRCRRRAQDRVVRLTTRPSARATSWPRCHAGTPFLGQ